jgi:hypothetical protein
MDEKSSKPQVREQYEARIMPHETVSSTHLLEYASGTHWLVHVRFSHNISGKCAESDKYDGQTSKVSTVKLLEYTTSQSL